MIKKILFLALCLFVASVNCVNAQFPFNFNLNKDNQSKKDTLTDIVVADSAINRMLDNKIDSLQDSIVIKQPGVMVERHDVRWDTLVHKYAQINESNCPDLVRGYRIQIFSSSGTGSSQRAREARTRFLSFFPDLIAYNDYSSPNFRVRIGNYRTKLEAEKVRMKISQEYPSAFIVPDFIETPITQKCQELQRKKSVKD